jgi:hypothetical protein
MSVLNDQGFHISEQFFSMDWIITNFSRKIVYHGVGLLHTYLGLHVAFPLIFTINIHFSKYFPKSCEKIKEDWELFSEDIWLMEWGRGLLGQPAAPPIILIAAAATLPCATTKHVLLHASLRLSHLGPAILLWKWNHFHKTDKLVQRVQINVRHNNGCHDCVQFLKFLRGQLMFSKYGGMYFFIEIS